MHTIKYLEINILKRLEFYNEILKFLKKETKEDNRNKTFHAYGIPGMVFILHIRRWNIYIYIYEISMGQSKKSDSQSHQPWVREERMLDALPYPISTYTN